jgi:hypothetical protein
MTVLNIEFRAFPFSTTLLALARLACYLKPWFPHLTFNCNLWEPWLLETLVSLVTLVHQFLYLLFFSSTSSFTENLETHVKPRIPTVDLDPTACY